MSVSESWGVTRRTTHCTIVPYIGLTVVSYSVVWGLMKRPMAVVWSRKESFYLADYPLVRAQLFWFLSSMAFRGKDGKHFKMKLCCRNIWPARHMGYIRQRHLSTPNGTLRRSRRPAQSSMSSSYPGTREHSWHTIRGTRREFSHEWQRSWTGNSRDRPRHFRPNIKDLGNYMAHNAEVMISTISDDEGMAARFNNFWSCVQHYRQFCTPPDWLLRWPCTSVQFSSVQLQNLCFTQSYNKNYDGCADA